MKFSQRQNLIKSFQADSREEVIEYILTFMCFNFMVSINHRDYFMFSETIILKVSVLYMVFITPFSDIIFNLV
jgi:hypothetical protein